MFWVIKIPLPAFVDLEDVYMLKYDPFFSRENGVQSHEKVVHGHKDGKADLNPVPSDSPKTGIGNTVWVTEGRGHC